MPVKVTQSCPTLCDPTDYTGLGILQDRIREWVAFPFSSRSAQPMNWPGSPALAGGLFTTRAAWEAPLNCEQLIIMLIMMMKHLLWLSW